MKQFNYYAIDSAEDTELADDGRRYPCIGACPVAVARYTSSDRVKWEN